MLRSNAHGVKSLDERSADGVVDHAVLQFNAIVFGELGMCAAKKNSECQQIGRCNQWLDLMRHRSASGIIYTDQWLRKAFEEYVAQTLPPAPSLALSASHKKT